VGVGQPPGAEIVDLKENEKGSEERNCVWQRKKEKINGIESYGRIKRLRSFYLL
jgi:hypothetical protein